MSSLACPSRATSTSRSTEYMTLHLSTTDRQQAAQGIYLKNRYHELAGKPLDDRALIYYKKDL